MADADRMTRKELLAARDKVKLQLERLNYRGTYSSFGTIGGYAKDQLGTELDAILEEINAELSELGQSASKIR